MKIVVTGASGAFGGQAAALLLDVVPPADLILLSRTPAKLAAFAARGADVRHADFDNPASLPAAFAGGERMLLISTARVGTRVGQHRHAVQAAVAAGVGHIVYTSLLGAAAAGNPAIVKDDHRATEEIIEGSGAAWTFLRDSQYAEAVAGPMVIPVLLSGAPKPDNCGDGRVAFVSRDDCVATAVAVLTGEGHADRAYDLTGPELFTIPQALALAGEIAGRSLRVAATDDAGMFAYFDSLGVPRHASDVVPDGPIPWSSDDMVTFGQAIREGYFDRVTDHVERITGRAPKSLRAVMLAHRAKLAGMIRALVLAAATAAFVAATVAGQPPAAPVGAGDDWSAPGGDAGKTHFSRLDDITPANVGGLGFAWSYDLGTNRGQEATPVVIDGVMYTSGQAGRVYALDAASGRELWTFTPDVDMQAARAACCDMVNRGVAVSAGKVIVAALDGMLYALNAKTGAIAWKTDTIVDRGRGYTSTGAPEVAGELVLIGNAGAEYDTRGYVTAYRIADGREAWRFYTVPHDPRTGPQETPELKAAAQTWDPNSRWDIGGGGTVWDAIAYEAATGTVFVGVGNGGPYSIAMRSPRGGDNLYLSSIVALDARTGRAKWHYQETPGDSWDYTATQPMILADVTIGGTRRPVILHAPKNGYLFVIDRATGKPLAANALVRTSWAKGYDLTSGRPVMNPAGANFWEGPKIVFPGSPGARNWFPGAWDAARGLYFASVLDMGNLVFPTAPADAPRRAKALNTGAALIFTPDLVEALPTLPPPVRAAVEALPEMKWVRDKPYTAEIRAIDPLTGKTRWAAPTGGWQDRGGVMATASGLIFHGALDGRLIARDANTGRLLKAIDTGSSIMAAPMTYRVKGVQYVAVAAGFGGGGWPYVPAYAAAYRYGNANRLLVFRLGGGPMPRRDPLPPLTVAPPPPPQAPRVTQATILRGQGLFFTNCAICHANQPRSTAPDLRRLDPAVHDAFEQILLSGALVDAGMPRWDDVLSKSDAAAIHAYLIDLQGKTRTRELALRKAGKPLDTRSLAILSNY